MIKYSEEFKHEAMRIALSTGLTPERVAADLGIGKSTLGKWLVQFRPTDLTPAPQADLARENEQLRKMTAHWAVRTSTGEEVWRR